MRWRNEERTRFFARIGKGPSTAAASARGGRSPPAGVRRRFPQRTGNRRAVTADVMVCVQARMIGEYCQEEASAGGVYPVRLAGHRGLRRAALSRDLPLLEGRRKPGLRAPKS